MVNRKNSIFDIPLALPITEEKRRNWYEKMITNAQKRISNFAFNHQWSDHISQPLIKEVRVYETKEQFDKDVKIAFRYDSDIDLPQSFSAVIADGILLIVTEEIYAENYKVGQEDHAYEKLLAHEMAHELHIRILDRNEEQMGPRWFFEGFALYAANQFEDTMLELSNEDIVNIISSEQSSTYAYYRLLMDKLLLHIDLKKAVEHAKYPNFDYFVRKLLKLDF
ncbi:hypothetical protein LGQ02_11735 [Bacillus shivajii]|uniref:hypothetical protein n=1 Tax=Bacillus shivajii TaxID=1983719 RepID=UPI001CFABBB9|nr:hypothetical protein [Bacillus shivajii]UCZ51543.1 hypothetical protein LGQ02_11735 [Bacillus shivajii]